MLSNFPDNFRRNDEEEVLNEFRQKQVSFDIEERKNEINNSRSLFVGALAGLLMAGVVGWFVLAPRYQSNDPEDVPIITRPQTVVKMLPSEPGDVEFSSQERTVYEIIEKKPYEEEQTQIAAPIEQPNVEAIDRLVEESVLPETEKTAPAGVESLMPSVDNTKTAATESEKVVETVTTAEVAQEVSVAKTAEVKEIPAVKKELAQAPVASVKSGSWQVQMMSSPNKAAVEKSWQTMLKKYAMLKDQPHEIESANLGAKGTFYRLKVGSFATKSEATSFCASIKAAGGSCFTAKK